MLLTIRSADHAAGFMHETHFQRFDSAAEFMEAARKGSYNVFDVSDKFIGRDFDNSILLAIQAIHQPWQAGAEVVAKYREQLEAAMPAPVSRRRKKRFNEDGGDEVDHDRLRSGQPYWQQAERETSTGPATITIAINVSANAYVSWDNILWRSAAAIVTTELLEDAGYRVELWGVAVASNAWRTREKGTPIDGVTGVLLKPAYAPLDTEVITNLMSGWAFRTTWFRNMASTHGQKEIQACYGLGQAQLLSQAMIQQLTDTAYTAYVFDRDLYDFEKSLDRAQEIIEQITD